MTLDKNRRDSEDIDVEGAIKRMQAHSRNTSSSFGKHLKVKAPKSAYGRFAGPTKT